MADVPQAANRPKSIKLFIIIGTALFLAGIGGGAWFSFFKGEKDPSASTPAQGHVYRMDPFLVNLADPGQLRYLKVSLHLESSLEKPSEEYDKRLPQLRDAILTVLSGKQYREIMSAEGKSGLREEIKAKANQLLVGFKAQNIYFTEFVIQ